MNFHSGNIIRHISFIFKIILVHIFILFNLPAFAENKIGSVTAIEGSAISINTNDEERELSIFDSIYINDEIFVSEDSTLTIQYLDNTTIILKEFTNLNVNEFEKSELSQKFNAKLEKGEIVIESGSIAKSSKGEMLIDLSKLQLGVRGTRINLNINESGDSKVILAEDSFGNVGEVSLNIEGQTTNLENSNEVVELNQSNEFSRRSQTAEEAEELNTVNNSLVEVSKINEVELEQQLNEKLKDGKLDDANNDGIINQTDIEVVKENIKNEKKANLDFIVENSKTDNTEFLSDVLDQSDEKNIGETITKIIEVKDDLIEDVVDNLSDKDNTFITSSTSEEVVAVKEKIFETIVSKETTKSAEVLSKVMSKSDEGTVSAVISNITEKNTNKDSTLSLKVMADFSEKNPEKLEILEKTNAQEVEKLTVDAINKASSSNEDVDLIAKVVSAVSDDLVNKVVEEVSKTSTEEKQNLSAKVLQAIVEQEPDKINIINDDVKETMIEQTIEAAKNQQEGTGIQEEEDLTDIISDIIVNTDTETASKVIEEINDIDTETNLSLEVISGISEKDTEKLNELSENNKAQMEELTETAIQNAENTAEDSQLIANVVAVVNDEFANKVVEEVSKTSTDEKQTLSAKVLKAIVDKDSTKVEILNDDIKDVIIEQTIESAKNQEEGTGIQEENNLTDIVSDIIVNTDAETAEKIINEVNEIETETNLSLKVISGISEKDTEKLNELAENNLEQIEQLTTDAVQNAENTSQDSELIASVITSANDELLNKVVETVNQVAQEESDKETLSAKVLQSIVDNQPDKIDVISEDNKNQLIENVVEVAKKQKEGDVEDEIDFTEVITNIVANSEIDTASKVLEEVNKIETDSDFKLDFIEELNEEENFSEKIDILSATSIKNDEFLTNIINEAVQKVDDEEGIEKLTGILNDSEGTIIDKIIDAGNLNLENKGKLNEALTNIADDNPNKLIDIIENNESANETVEELKNKVENNEAITLDDFEEVFDRNVTPN